MKYILVILLTLVATSLWSLGPTKLDSLYSELAKHPQGIELIDTYIAITEVQSNAEAHDSVLKYANLIFSLSEIESYQEGMATAYVFRADYYSSVRKYESSLVELKRALQIRQKYDLGVQSIGDVHVALGNAYQRNGMIVEGLAEYQKATDIFIENNLLIESTIPMTNQGYMYLNLDDTTKAKEYYFEAKRISDELGAKGHSYGNILNGIGNYYLQTSQFDSMMVYYQKALKIFEAVDYKTGIANGNNNIAIAYYYLEQPEKALIHFHKALMVRQILKDRIGESQSFNNIGLYYEGFEDYESAIIYFQKSLDLASEIEAKSEMFDATQGLYETYEKLSDYKNAFAYRDSMYILKQLISQENHMRSFEDLEAKYNAKNLDKEIVQLNELRTIDAALSEEKHFANNLIIGGVSIVALVLACLGVVLLLGNKRKRAVNLKLTNQKSEIEKQKDQIEQINTDIHDSIQYAEQIQRAILPEKHDLGQLGDYFMLYMPRDIVSGDFYWCFKRGDDQYFAVADCTGHGVPGAFISMLCHNAISQVIIEKGESDPGEILSLVNKEVLKRLKKKGDKFQASDGMDIILCKYNKIQSSFKFSGAFNSLLLLSKRSIIEHKVDRVAIGGTTDFDFEFKTQDLEYSSGDIVYLRTDGYQDQFGGKKGKRFLKKKLNAILQNFETVEMQDQQEILVKELAEWQLGYRQVDDITLMGLKLS